MEGWSASGGRKASGKPIPIRGGIKYLTREPTQGHHLPNPALGRER